MEKFDIPTDPIERRKTFEDILRDSTAAVHDFLHRTIQHSENGEWLKAEVCAKGGQLFLKQVIDSIQELKNNK